MFRRSRRGLCKHDAPRLPRRKTSHISCIRPPESIGFASPSCTRAFILFSLSTMLAIRPSRRSQESPEQ